MAWDLAGITVRNKQGTRAIRFATDRRLVDYQRLFESKIISQCTASELRDYY